jgi:hypothetical protein
LRFSSSSSSSSSPASSASSFSSSFVSHSAIQRQIKPNYDQNRRTAPSATKIRTAVVSEGATCGWDSVRSRQSGVPPVNGAQPWPAAQAVRTNRSVYHASANFIRAAANCTTSTQYLPMLPAVPASVGAVSVNCVPVFQ